MSWKPIKNTYYNGKPGEMVLIISPKAWEDKGAINIDNPDTYELFSGNLHMHHNKGNARQYHTIRHDGSLVGAWNCLFKDIRRWIVAVWDPGKNYGDSWKIITKKKLEEIQ